MLRTEQLRDNSDGAQRSEVLLFQIEQHMYLLMSVLQNPRLQFDGLYHAVL